jgi:hypothetical protein
MCMFYRSLFVHLSFFFRPLCCLYFFKSRLLITPLVSSNFSYYIKLFRVHLVMSGIRTFMFCRYTAVEQRFTKRDYIVIPLVWTNTPYIVVNTAFLVYEYVSPATNIQVYLKDSWHVWDHRIISVEFVTMPGYTFVDVEQY